MAQMTKESMSMLTDAGVREYDFRAITPCVYFLVRNKRVMYAGKTVNLQRRIETHLAQKPWFNHVLYIATDVDKLSDREAEWVQRLKPEWNLRNVGTPLVHHQRYVADTPTGYLAALYYLLERIQWAIDRDTASGQCGPEVQGIYEEIRLRHVSMRKHVRLNANACMERTC